MESELTSFERLIEPIEQKMIDSVWRITRDKHDFDEAFQRALETIWRRWEKIQRHPHPQACALRVCANAAYDVLRARKRRGDKEISLETPDALPDPQRNGVERLQAGEQEQEIFAAIARLPKRQSEAVLMRFAQESSYRDIARALNCSEAAARQHVCRAREKLSVALNHLLSPPPQETPS